MTHKITIIPGDGIGPEIMEATLLVLESTGVELTYEECLAGHGSEEKTGNPLPEITIESLNRTKVALKAPLIVHPGSPPVTIRGKTYGSTNGAMRGVCQAFANIRPSRGFPGVSSRFTDLDIDLVIVREVSEGVYVGGERIVEPGRAEAVVLATERAAERIIRFGFELASRDGRKRVTLAHKANVLPYTDGMYLQVFNDISGKYPDISTDARMIDAAAAEMVTRPDLFDVIVAPNQYGDILSDIASAITGGLGLGPGGNYGEEIAMFEAIHGAAPDIAGQNIANPIAFILSGAMMLDHLGELNAAHAVRQSVEKFLEQGEGLTPDLGGTGTTQSAAKIIARIIQETN